MTILDINKTTMKFGPKQSTLKFWVFGLGAQGSSCHIRTKNLP